jgi:hypothetical protein
MGTHMKKNVTVAIFDKENDYGDEWPPTDIAGFQTWFTSQVAKIPVEFLHTAKIELSSVVSYEDSAPTICISYTRQETDLEQITRIQRTESAQAYDRQREMETLADLLEKYPNFLVNKG